MLPATSGWRAILSTAAEPTRPMPYPAPMIVIAAPIAPERWKAGMSAAMAGIDMAKKIATVKYTTFRHRFTVLSPVFEPIRTEFRKLVRVNGHADKERGQKGENVRLQKRNEQFEHAD